MVREISVKMWSSSHLCHWHSVPEFIQQGWCTRFARPEIDAQSGRKMSDLVENDVTDDMIFKYSSGINQVQLILLGGNNIDDGEEPENLESHVRRILDFALSLENVHLVICGLMPRGRYNQGSTEKFLQANKSLFKLCQGYKNTSFLNFFKIYIKHGIFQEQYFKPDLVHVNSYGAQIMARSIINHLNTFVKKKTFTD